MRRSIQELEAKNQRTCAALHTSLEGLSTAVEEHEAATAELLAAIEERRTETAAGSPDA